MEDQKGEYGEQGFLPVPLFISASCFSSFSARHKGDKQEQQWPPARQQCPQEALVVSGRIKSFYLLVFVCVFNNVWFRPVI